MTEKVKITQAQADAIETIGVDYRRHDIVRQHVIGKWGEELESINHLTTDEVIKALYIGYEVEPEFLVGDWVVDEADDDKMFQLVRGSFIDSLNHGKYTVVRHATESEIAQVKERRWWGSHGREPGQIKTGDILIRKINGFPRVNVDHDLLPEGYRVACFVDKRLDTSQ